MNPTSLNESRRQENAERDALLIYNAGWRQGSAFYPVDVVRTPFPFDTENEVLVVASQSCSVVSTRFDVDPDVEVLAAKKLSEFRPHLFEAKGRNQRRLHLKLPSSSACKALEYDLGRRLFIPRKLLLDLTRIKELSVDHEGSKSLSNWIARSYVRNAFSEEMGKRIKISLFPKIKSVLEKSFEGAPLASEITNVAIDWQPREEEISGLLVLRFIFVCKSTKAAHRLEEQLTIQLEKFMSDEGMDGVHIAYLRCAEADEVTFADVDSPYERLTQWDYLTNLGDLVVVT